MAPRAYHPAPHAVAVQRPAVTTDAPSPQQLARYADAFNASETLKHFGVRVSFPDAATCEVVLSELTAEGLERLLSRTGGVHTVFIEEG